MLSSAICDDSSGNSRPGVLGQLVELVRPRLVVYQRLLALMVALRQGLLVHKWFLVSSVFMA